MTQNLYAGEGNDRGWYRVNRENKKLKREVENLKAENKSLQSSHDETHCQISNEVMWKNDALTKVEQLRKMLKLARVYIIDEQIIGSGRTIEQINKALKGDPK